MGPRERRETPGPTINTVPERPPEPIIATLGETWSATAQACEGLHPDAWDLPTDCPGWTVRDQLSHLIGTELGLLGRAAPAVPDPMPDYVRNPLGQLNEAWIEERRGVPGIEVLAEFVDVTNRRLIELEGFPPERWDMLGWSPAGEAPYREFMQIREFDCWIHGQDIRRAVDRPGERGGAGEKIALERVTMGMAYVVGRKVAPPHGTTVVFDLGGSPAHTVTLHMNGKRAEGRDDAPTSPTVRIVMAPEHFVRLGCGREDPEAALGSGELAFEGDQELGTRVVQAMDFMI